jgi:FG-GAP repeat
MTTHSKLPQRLDRSSARPARTLVVLLAIAVAACGGDPANPSANSAVAVNPPATFDITASLSSVKKLTLAWPASPADRAHVFEDPDGGGPLPAEQLADVPAADGTATVEIFLPVALQASYHVALCKAGQCVDSAPLRLQGTLEQAMGRFKAGAPQVFAEFGVSVAMSQNGLVLAVGAKTGSVEVFERTGMGQWTARGEVTGAPAGSLRDTAMALSANGAVLAVGLENGTVHIHRRQGDQWVFDTSPLGSEVVGSDLFGYSLALSADGLTLAVGAPKDDGPGDGWPGDGAVYVFTDTGGTWTQTHLLRGGNSAPHDNFGQAVAISGDGTVLAIGSPYDDASGLGVYPSSIDNAGAEDSGAVYVYRRSGNGWELEAFAKPPINLGVGNFGAAVALDAAGNTLAVSAPDADIDPQGALDLANHRNSGSVHVLTRANGQWTPQGAPLRSAVPRRDELFGLALALSADGRVVAVGSWENDYSGVGVALTESSTPVSNAGSGYVFLRLAGGWGTASVLEPSDRSTDVNPLSIRMGSAVAIGGSGRSLTVAVGARSHDGPVSVDPAITYSNDPSMSGSGAVFLY